jgi:hypothetical protein
VGLPDGGKRSAGICPVNRGLPPCRHLLVLSPGIQCDNFSSRKAAPSGLNLDTREMAETVRRVTSVYELSEKILEIGIHGSRSSSRLDDRYDLAR